MRTCVYEQNANKCEQINPKKNICFEQKFLSRDDLLQGLFFFAAAAGVRPPLQVSRDCGSYPERRKSMFFIYIMKEKNNIKS